MKPPFDIAGDLDTPVSAFAKLADREGTREAVESGVLEEPAVVTRCTSHFPTDEGWR